MQFKVPQFLDIEDKIFGPFTFREFVYLVGGAGLCFVLYKALGFLLGLIPMIIVAGFALALTFYRPNDKPFVEMLESAVKYMTRDKLYIWKKRKAKKEAREAKDKLMQEEMHPLYGSKLGRSKLRDLAWSLDVLDLKKGDN